MCVTGNDLESHATVLRESTSILERASIPYVVFGSLATVALARPRALGAEEDIDLLVRPPDAARAADALASSGFVVDETDPSWIRKAKRLGVTVDLIHRAGREVHPDTEMLERATTVVVLGITVRLIPPEDLAVIKAVLHDETRPGDWFDALALVARPGTDWDYLLRRARGHGVQRVLSLLLYARTDGTDVPERVLAELLDAVPR
jgi:predicted nucleotidyltransferase